MAFNFGPVQSVFGLEIRSLLNFVFICLCFLLLSTFTEFLNLLQTNLYKFNVERRKLASSPKEIATDDITSDISSSDEQNDNEEHSSVSTHLLRKLPFHFAETKKDYEYLFSPKHITSKAAEAKFNRLMFLIEMIVYFMQTIISYSLMQAIMSENFWIFTSIVLGYVLGYFLFYNDLSVNLILFAKLFEIYKRNLN